MDTPARTVRVPPGRLPGWLDRFAERHGTLEISAAGDALSLRAPDGAAAVLSCLLVRAAPATLEEYVAEVQRERRVGGVLVRRGGWGVGVWHGDRLLESKVGSGYVQGRTKAGGWSQQRYARRREHQAAQSYGAAADAAVRVLLPLAATVVAVLGGGDRPGVEAVLADPRLTAVRDRWTSDVLHAPDPRLRVLEAFPEQYRAVRVTLNEAAVGGRPAW